MDATANKQIMVVKRKGVHSHSKGDSILLCFLFMGTNCQGSTLRGVVDYQSPQLPHSCCSKQDPFLVGKSRTAAAQTHLGGRLQEQDEAQKVKKGTK